LVSFYSSGVSDRKIDDRKINAERIKNRRIRDRTMENICLIDSSSSSRPQSSCPRDLKSLLLHGQNNP
jgi:hypothetical protein